MARRSTPEIVAGLVIVAGAVGGGFVAIASGHGGSGSLATIVRCLAGLAIGGALTVIAVGLTLFAFEGIKTASGNPSHEPTLADVAPQFTSVADARMYSMASVACLVIGVFIAIILMWFFALVFALLARKASGEDKRWRRATTVLWAATALALVAMLLLGSGLVSS
ncbi:MAG TPA: hypothetical protein VN108_02430 [Marmoricola sp.]|nr:hypothetical protein [Marmoricola sp.]